MTIHRNNWKKVRTIIVKSLITLIYLGYHMPFICKGQENPVTLPASPTASVLGEYGSTPISLAIGTPDIAIPLYEIKGRTLSLPISLSYRASGIKVEETGSEIGIGWALNAGGVISRSIRGNGERGVTNWPDGQGMVPKRISNIHSEGMSNDEMHYFIQGADTEPDIYYYNFSSYSGKFLFQDNGNVVIFPDVDFEIKYTFGEPGITIKDSEGTTYYFQISESSEAQEGNSFYTAEGSNITAWYLTKIESFDKSEIIEFQYEGELYYQEGPRRAQKLLRTSGPGMEIGNLTHGDRVECQAVRLRRITTNFGYRVEFIPGVDRKLDGNAKTISRIETYYNDTCFKNFDLISDFVETNYPVLNYYNPQIYPTWANFRLYLNEVKIRDCSSQNILSYNFTYYGRQNGKDLLPNKLSLNQDHWGYYNGEKNNTTLIPTWSGYVPTDGQGAYITVAGADRTPSFPEMQSGTLESIQYPTGGKTVFTYSAHKDAYDEIVGGLRISAIGNYVDGQLVRKKEYEYLGGAVVGKPQYEAGYFYYTWDQLHPFRFEDCLNEYDCRTYRLLTSGLPIALGSTNGSHISYSYVKEKEIGNGYTEYRYTSASLFPDFQSFANGGESILDVSLFNCRGEGGTIEQWPFTPTTDWSWKRGLLTSEIVYKENQTQPIKTTVNTHDYSFNKILYGTVVKQVKLPCSIGSLGHFTLFYYRGYKIDVGMSRITQQIITENGIVKVIDKEYQNNLLTKVSALTSDNKTTEISYQYPQSTIFDTAPELGSDLLRSAHKLTPILRSTKKVNGIEVYRQENLHTIPEHLSVPLLTEIRDYPSGNSSEKKVLILDYDTPGTPKRTQILNGASTCYLWDYNNQLLIAHVANALPDDIAYTSFEADGKGNWVFNTATIDDNTSPTGKKCYPLGSIQKTGLTASKTYTLSYWYNAGAAVTVTGGTSSNIQTIAGPNGWTLQTRNITGATSVSISGTGRIDEVRLHPVNAQMTTHTYNPLIGVTTATDANNMIAYYEYDTFGRLQAIKDHKKNILETYQYHYKQ